MTELDDSMNAMYHELLGSEADVDGNKNVRLDFEDAERERLRVALEKLNTPFEGRSFEELYETAEMHIQDVLGTMAKYERWQDTLALMEKRERAKLDAQLSGEKNPATGKGYTRDAIAAVIECDDQIILLTDRKLECKANINFLRKFYDLYRLHFDRIVNVNVNARRAWETTQ